MRAAWYVTGTIRVAVCNRIFTRASWFQVLSLPQKAEEERREGQNREKLGGGIFETPPPPVSWLNEFTCLLIPLERWITSTFWGGGEGGREVVPVIGLGLGLGLRLFCL